MSKIVCPNCGNTEIYDYAYVTAEGVTMYHKCFKCDTEFEPVTVTKSGITRPFEREEDIECENITELSI